MKLEKLRKRKPFGHLDNYQRVIDLVTAKRVFIRKGEIYIERRG